MSGKLLSSGTTKLGESIFGWSIPALQTCPGRTQICSRWCYALHGRFVTEMSKRKMEWRLRQAKRADFVNEMIDEIYRRGVLIVRIHVSGDYFSPTYACKWVEIVSRLPDVRFFCYTRSWRSQKIEPVLRTLATLSNMRLWYSADCDAYPEHVPQGVRVAYMQSSDQETVNRGDLVFQVRKLRRMALPLAIPICEQEVRPQDGVNCSNCKICWQ